MKIESLKIKNFRSYREEITIRFNDLTVLVGKNDIGKSTILEALDIFFNDGNGVVKIDKTDLNTHALKNGDTETVISVCFSELPSSIVIDSQAETTLAGEYMLNSEGLLEVIKKYKNGGKASVFIRAKHPTCVDCKELLHKKNTELKRIITSKKINCENQAINMEMRKAIWNHYANDLDIQEIEIDMLKEDAKVIWDKLSSYLPVYSLFQSDRKNSDGDSEVQDPLKEAVKQIINDKDLQQTLTSVAGIVEAKLKEVSGRTLEKLREMDPEIANSLTPVIPTSDKLKWADVFKAVSISGDENIPINKRGSGVKRLVLLNFFRAEAEQRAGSNNTGIIYAIEEPETSQHSNNQRVLVKALKHLAQSNNTQVLLTTHSPVIVKELDFRDLRLIYSDEVGKKILSVEPAVLQYPSLNEVNYAAYGEITEEYHNELYGYLDCNNLLNDYQKGRPTRAYYLHNKGGKPIKWDLDLTAYVRHQIHHPENQMNVRFTHEELKQSIEDMRSYIKNKANTVSAGES